jgi:hypothetical protein
LRYRFLTETAVTGAPITVALVVGPLEPARGAGLSHRVQRTTRQPSKRRRPERMPILRGGAFSVSPLTGYAGGGDDTDRDLH